jgi:hypothetical protein
MKKNYLIAGIIILIAIGAFFVIQNKNGGGGQIACTMEAKLCPDGSAVGRQGPNCEFAPCPGQNEEQEIRVSAPKPNDAVGLPLVIAGEAKVFQNVFGYRLLNADGKKLLEGFGEAKASAAGLFEAFELAVNYPDPETETGTLEIIEFAIKTGLEESKTVIPVRFAPVEATDVKLYFNNSNKDPKSVSCETTYPTTRRVAKTPAIATEALRELLRGVTGAETSLGFMTGLNPGVELLSLNIENGVAKADFNEALQKGVAGSCRVTAIRSQIENTLKQFPAVQSVIISVQGRSEDVLQP